MALPSLTMVVRADEPEDPEDVAGLAGAIERAHLYLDKVRFSAANLATEYEENEDIQGYLKEINELLDQNGEEDPENLLETTGDVGSGNEDRVRINMPEGTVLNDIVSISWDYYLYYGYAPHVDIILETDALVIEWAYNDVVGTTGHHTTSLTGDWYATFDDGTEGGPAVVTDTTMAMLASGAPGPLGGELGDGNFWFASLADWKTGITFDSGSGSKTIDGDTPVLALEFEVDNWIVQTKAEIDNIKMNDNVIYNFEEELEGLGAEGYLVQASAYLDEGDIRSAARCLASARNILGRVKGLLNSMAKTHKVARIDRFRLQFEHRLEGLEDKVYRLRGRLGEGVNQFKASMGLAKGKLRQLDEDFPGNNVDLDELENPTDLIDAGFEELDADTLEAIYRLEAKIRVLKASADRLERKGADTFGIEEDLKEAEVKLETIMNLLEEGKTDEVEILLEEAEELVSGVSGEIQVIRKGQHNKGSMGKGRK